MKKCFPIVEVVAMLVALFVLGSEAESLMVFLISKAIALTVFVACAWDLNLLNKKHK